MNLIITLGLIIISVALAALSGFSFAGLGFFTVACALYAIESYRKDNLELRKLSDSAEIKDAINQLQQQMVALNNQTQTLQSAQSEVAKTNEETKAMIATLKLSAVTKRTQL